MPSLDASLLSTIKYYIIPIHHTLTDNIRNDLYKICIFILCAEWQLLWWENKAVDQRLYGQIKGNSHRCLGCPSCLAMGVLYTPLMPLWRHPNVKWSPARQQAVRQGVTWYDCGTPFKMIHATLNRDNPLHSKHRIQSSFFSSAPPENCLGTLQKLNCPAF